MIVEEKIREALSAYAEAIEPNAGSLARIADRTQRGGHVIPWLRYMPAALAMAAAITVAAIQMIPDRSPVLQLATTTPTPVSVLDASYTSPSGDWTFDYPKDWTLADDGNNYGPYGGSLFNFESRRLNDDLRDNGEIWIHWGAFSLQNVPDGKRMKSTQEIFDRVCAGRFTSSDCRMVEINGRTWVRWLSGCQCARDEKILNVSAIINDKAYRAQADVGPGDRQSGLLDVASQIFDTFVIR
jgi:hypothetical protein